VHRIDFRFRAQAMAALLTHRRPEVTLNPASGALQKHATEVREALALSLHHVPLVTTFAFVACDGAHSEPLMVVDPTVLEEKTCDSTMLVRLHGIVLSLAS
jgi:exosome complex RNA-binding protein Rrp42 (RNase PH superfamily)